MKKIFLLLMVLVLAIGVNSATAPTYSATSAVYMFGVDTTVASADGFDTISANTDTVVFFTLRPIEKMKQVSLALTNKGTIDFYSSGQKLYIEALVYDGGKTLIYTTIIDSLTDSTGTLAAGVTSIIDLQVGAKIQGEFWTLRARDAGDPGTVRFGPIAVLERVPVTIDKKW